MSKCVDEKKLVSKGKSNRGAILRQPCRDLKGTCTRSLCEFWHPPESQFYKNESGCKAGDTCLFPHHKVNEQTNKKPKKRDHPPNNKEKLNLKCVVSRKTRSYWNLKEAQSLGEN